MIPTADPLLPPEAVLEGLDPLEVLVPLDRLEAPEEEEGVTPLEVGREP